MKRKWKKQGSNNPQHYEIIV